MGAMQSCQLALGKSTPLEVTVVVADSDNGLRL